MKTYSVVICFVLLTLVCGFCNALQVYQNDSQLIQTSDQIVFGKIVDVKSAWNDQKTHIETTAQIQVEEAFIKSDKTGISSGSIIPVTILGGKEGNTTEWVEDMPVFVPDTDAFVYLKKTNGEKFSVNGLNRGVHYVSYAKTGSINIVKSSSGISNIQFFKEKITKTLQGVPIEESPSGSFKYLSPPLGSANPIITSVSPSTASAGTDTTITITGSGFGSRASRASINDVVFSSGPDDWTYASGWPAFDLQVGQFIVNGDSIESWTDTQIRVKVPTGLTNSRYWSGACSGWLVILSDTGAATTQYPFTVTFGYSKTWGNAKWKWNSAPTYYVNTGSLSGISGSLTAIQNAGSTWNNAVLPGSFFRFNYGGTTSTATVANDGTSAISLGSPADFISRPGTIASANCFASGEFLSNCDIEMNPSLSWTTGTASGNTVNVESVILHELGHWVGLQDLYGYEPGYPSDLSPEIKVMFGLFGDSLGNMNIKALSTADRDGIRWIYPVVNTSPIVTSITPASGENTGSVTITNLAGTNFADGAIVLLTRSGSANVTATGVSVVSPSRITCTFSLIGTTDGNSYNVIVRNPDGKEGMLSNGFMITGPWLGGDSIAIFRPSTGYWYFDNNLDGIVDTSFRYGGSSDQIITGDWDGDGKDGIAIFRPSTGYWYFDYNRDGTVEKSFRFGGVGDQIAKGNWSGDGKDGIAIFRPSTGYWYFDNNLDGVVDKSFRYGGSTDRIVAGKWI